MQQLRYDRAAAAIGFLACHPPIPPAHPPAHRSRGLHTALWRLLHPLTYNNKEQRAVFAANRDYIRTAAAALSLPNSGAWADAGAPLLARSALPLACWLKHGSHGNGAAGCCPPKRRSS